MDCTPLCDQTKRYSVGLGFAFLEQNSFWICENMESPKIKQVKKGFLLGPPNGSTWCLKVNYSEDLKVMFNDLPWASQDFWDDAAMCQIYNYLRNHRRVVIPAQWEKLLPTLLLWHPMWTVCWKAFVVDQKHFLFHEILGTPSKVRFFPSKVRFFPTVPDPSGVKVLKYIRSPFFSSGGISGTPSKRSKWDKGNFTRIAISDPNIAKKYI